METRLKMRISRMFRSSFASCRARNFSDVTEKAVFPHHDHRGFHPIDPSSPKPRPFPSICGPKALETSETIDSSLPRKKVSEWPSSPFRRGNHGGRSCPPASPITPLNPVYEDEFGYCEKLRHSGRNEKIKKKKKKKGTRKKRKPSDMFPFNSCAQDGTIGGYWWYSNDDDDDSEGEDETDTLFSSRSLSSDSSRSRRRRHRSCQKKKEDGDRVGPESLSSEMGVMPLKGRVKDTFAVVKQSSDPYNDFRTSMVEMIVEKQIFAPEDLENLLQCFLSLNSHNHHKIIVEVFTEIWEALFSDWF
ncbi:transcription repressor OFP8 [Prosopis cineraria]|uniref:transcription repressor OFP8 n=1 Tax=Prosopis cineraria TaxID=364024 RepID=UPI0024102BD2|nr:transcription repressor OFP8 [Prosopis cineraria]